MNDWYQVTQLQNFRQGIRGRHPGDMYGNQMVDMAQMLVDEEAVRNVVAYINTLAPASRITADSTHAGEE
jgi:cytochrome c oxidase subunit 2